MLFVSAVTVILLLLLLQAFVPAPAGLALDPALARAPGALNPN